MKKKKENWQLKREKNNIKKRDLYSELLEVKNMYKKRKLKKLQQKWTRDRWKMKENQTEARSTFCIFAVFFFPATDGVKSQTFPRTG